VATWTSTEPPQLVAGYPLISSLCVQGSDPNKHDRHGHWITIQGRQEGSQTHWRVPSSWTYPRILGWPKWGGTTQRSHRESIN